MIQFQTKIFFSTVFFYHAYEYILLSVHGKISTSEIMLLLFVFIYIKLSLHNYAFQFT